MDKDSMKNSIYDSFYRIEHVNIDLNLFLKFIFKKIESDISICKIILQISKIIKKVKLKKIFEF